MRRLDLIFACDLRLAVGLKGRDMTARSEGRPDDRRAGYVETEFLRPERPGQPVSRPYWAGFGVIGKTLGDARNLAFPGL